MSRCRSALFARFLLLAWVAVGCGGASKPASSSDATSEPRATSTEDEAASASSAEEGSASEPAAPKRATCDDGTCSSCGAAFCPTGWYCDESAEGGPACGWLPECAQKSGCACLKRAFAGCSCEEKNGAAHLSCG